MSEPLISARGLGKLFHRRLPRRRTAIGRLQGLLSGAPDSLPVWALRGAGFELGRGECLGVEGPNGSGKSTLLSLLAGILEPTEGSLRVNGRANAFLSLHAGVQPELSVADNVEICAILMGLRRREALSRADRILDFAGLRELGEVRMGELSSGQAARVVFSTVVHSDLEILLIDEALAVGDRDFQLKCVDAFARLRREGKTMVLVSHDEALLERLSTRRMRLRAGRVDA